MVHRRNSALVLLMVEPVKDAQMIHLALYSVESGYEKEFDDWYRMVHVPEVLSRDGWRSLQTYRCMTDTSRISIYDLDGAAATVSFLSEAPFREGPFTERGLRNYFARTWRQISERGRSFGGARWLNLVMLDVLPDYAESISRWYDEVHVPEILGCPGWLGNRRFESLDGDPRFLALYELSDPQLAFDSHEWARAVGWDEQVAGIRGFYGFRVYELMFNSESSAGQAESGGGDGGGEPFLRGEVRTEDQTLVNENPNDE